MSGFQFTRWLSVSSLCLGLTLGSTQLFAQSEAAKKESLEAAQDGQDEAKIKYKLTNVAIPSYGTSGSTESKPANKGSEDLKRQKKSTDKNK